MGGDSSDAGLRAACILSGFFVCRMHSLHRRCGCAVVALWVRSGGALVAKLVAFLKAQWLLTPLGDFHARRRCHASRRYVISREHAKKVAGLAHVEGPHGVCGQRVNVCMPLARARGTDAMALAWAWRTVCACEVW